MANEYVNKVAVGNETLIDLTNDTVDPSKLALGETAHDRSGAQIQGAAVFGTNIDDLSDSTDDIEDVDKLITQDGGSWVKKTFSKLWDYIKGKIQNTELTLTQTLVLAKSQDASGTANNGPALIVGGAVTGNHLELDGNEIMSKSNGTTPSALYLNNDGGVVFLGKEYYNTITGTGTAAQDKGEGVSPRYFPAKWTFNIPGGALTNGYRIQIIIPVAGHSYGVYLSIDNGTTYKPIVYQGTTRLTTHFGNGIPLELVYHSGGSVADIYPLAGGDERTTVSGGVWRVLNAYDANTTYSVMTAAQVGAGTDTTNRVMRADYLKTGMKTLLLDICYPVGTIYTSTKNVSPATFMGGTWKSLSGYFLYASTSSVTFNSNAKDGGANSVTVSSVASHNHTQDSHNHTQDTHNHTQNAHSHSVNKYDGTWFSNEQGAASGSGRQMFEVGYGTDQKHRFSSENTTATNVTKVATNQAKTATNQAKGADYTVSTLPNYKRVYMWERTA